MNRSCVTVTIIAAAMLISRWGVAATATGPSATPPSLSFSYQIPIPGIPTTLPAAAALKIALPSTASSSTIISSATCQTLPCPLSWLTITPGSALATQTLTVNVNPTNLPPGSYPGTIYITTSPDVGSLTVPVTFSVTNPPSNLVVSPGSTTANFTPANGATSDTLSFVYTTGSGWPVAHAAGIESELDVATTGDPITFNVTVAGSSGTGGKTIFLRVAPPGQTPGLQTNTLTVSGSAVPILVSIDQTVVQSLLPGGYSNSVTLAATSKANGSHTVAVSLQVTAGSPAITAVYPTSVVQAPLVNPIVTITGVNFFASSVSNT